MGMVGRECRSRLLYRFAFKSVTVLGCNGIEPESGSATCEFESVREYSCCDEVFGT